MAVQFNVLPSESQVFLAPYVSITAIDTTPAASAVSAWNWYFRNTLVSNTSTWTYNFFDPIEVNYLSLTVSSPYGTFSSSAVPITIEEAWPGVLSFEILPSDDIEMSGATNSVVITARDTSPAVSGVSAWSWTFNNVPMGNSSTFNYTFFDPITGTIGLTVSGPFGSSTLNSQTLMITRPRENACNRSPVTPEGWRASTTLNHAITSYNLLGDRIKMQLGWPMVNIELCDDMIYDYIDQAIEWYSKYAGYTEEYLMFDANRLYIPRVGIKMDDLFTKQYQWADRCSSTYNPSMISAQYVDCDLNNYRKVTGVFEINPVEFTGTDTLFTMDYMFAQQTYFSYMLGSFGWDLITWHILKDWLNLREKLFATRPTMIFDQRTQYLKLIPEPTSNNNFYGVVGCYVERPISQLVQERWVQRYALALSMIGLAHTRGKYGQVTLFGGGSLNSSDIMTQGLAQKEQLEKELMEQFGEVTPPLFFVY